jgi:hypothetical protein
MRNLAEEITHEKIWPKITHEILKSLLQRCKRIEGLWSHFMDSPEPTRKEGESLSRFTKRDLLWSERVALSEPSRPEVGHLEFESDAEGDEEDEVEVPSGDEATPDRDRERGVPVRMSWM